MVLSQIDRGEKAHIYSSQFPNNGALYLESVLPCLANTFFVDFVSNWRKVNGHNSPHVLLLDNVFPHT